MTWLIRLALLGGGVALFAVVALIGLPIAQPVTPITVDGDVQRGAYLARMSGCIACRTDQKAGGAPLAGGVQLATDFGTFTSPNLTTDKTHGIGAWSEEDFARAVRQGVSPEGQPYYPAFPYPFYASFSDQDVADLWVAFQTVPPAALASAPQQLSFPFNFRPGLKLWRSAFLEHGQFEPDPVKSEAWNRGKFIVEGPSHCGACHTPRNFAGAREVEMRLHGAEGLPDGGKAPPITADALRKGGWTLSTISYALKTGVMPDGDAFGSLMGKVVRDGTAFLSNDDLNAIATYLLDEDAPQ